MKILILAIVLTTVSAVPIPKSFGTDGRIGKQFYYPVPASYSQINSQYSNQVAPEYVINQRPVSYPNLVPNKDLGADGNIQLVLSVPSAVPPGTSLSVTVNVNSEPNGATVVSVSNPVVSAPAQAPAAPDSITVDAPSSGSATGTLPEDFDLREPVMFLPPFENSKDSPVLVAMQGEAQQQALAALLKTKTA